MLLALTAPLALGATPTPAPTWSVPADARIEHVEAGMQKGQEDNYMKEHCGDFTLSAEETLIYLRSAKVLPEAQVHDAFDWLPCVVRGTLVSGKKPRKVVGFEISALFTAHIYEEGKPTTYLVCEGACATRMEKILVSHEK
ncbi:hypothetical protein D7V97_21300 [Corallococcus sp. CA053C]|nr:hypothetical protein D7V97_21300 [Corallococcus sp. CA053C]